VIELGQHERFALEKLGGNPALLVVKAGGVHLLDCDGPRKPLIFGQVDRAEATAAQQPDDLVAILEELPCCEYLHR